MPERLPHGNRRGGTVVFTLIGALFLLIVAMHLAGVVGPGAH